MAEMNFNLTTPEGRKNALDAFDKYGWISFPQFWLLRLAWKGISEKTIKTVAAQKNVAIDLIRAGKEHGVEQMTIVLDQTIGMDIGAEVDGVPIKVKIGDSGHVVVSVKYK